MKNYLLSPEGLQLITDEILAVWNKQGGFMSTSGPTMMPLKLEQNWSDAIEGLLRKKQNFIFWITPDFRVVFVTKNGVVTSNGAWWKIRYEWRSQSADGKTVPSVARFDRQIKTAEVLPALATSFADI